MILVNMQNLKLLAVLLLEICDKNFLSRRGTSDRNSIFIREVSFFTGRGALETF